MGFLLDLGEFLTYEESKKIQENIKRQGVTQFLKLYKKNKNIKMSKCSDFRWGDEIEYQVINLDKEQNKVRIQTNNEYLFEENLDNEEFELHKEYGSWLVETIPSQPYNCWLTLNSLVKTFKNRRIKLTKLLPKDNYLFSLSFPSLGCGDYFIKNKL